MKWFPLSEWFKRFGRADLLVTTMLPRVSPLLSDADPSLSLLSSRAPPPSAASDPPASRPPLSPTDDWWRFHSCAFSEEQDRIQPGTSCRRLTKHRLYFRTVLDKLLYFLPQIRHRESRIDGFCRDELFLTSVSELTGAEPQAIFRTHN